MDGFPNCLKKPERNMVIDQAMFNLLKIKPK